MLSNEVVAALEAQLAKFSYLNDAGMSVRVPVEPESLRELLRVYRAWLDAPVGLVSPFSDANDRATFLYFNGKGDVQPGKQVRLVRDGDSGEVESC